MSHRVKRISIWAGPLIPTGLTLMAADPSAPSKSTVTWQVCVTAGPHCSACVWRGILHWPVDPWRRKTQPQPFSFLTVNGSTLDPLHLVAMTMWPQRLIFSQKMLQPHKHTKIHFFLVMIRYREPMWCPFWETTKNMNESQSFSSQLSSQFLICWLFWCNGIILQYVSVAVFLLSSFQILSSYKNESTKEELIKFAVAGMT